MNDLKEKILQGASKSLETFSIDKLKKIIITSEEEKREHGSLFCGTTDIPPFGNISHSGLYAGDQYNVELKGCKGKKQIGSFHTHPHTKMGKDIGNLSGKDIYESVYHKHSFSCIGLIEKGKPIIKCFIPAFDIDQIITLKVIKTRDNYGRKLLKVAEERPNVTKKSINELTKAYDERIEAENELYNESKSLLEKLLSKEADLIVR